MTAPLSEGVLGATRPAPPSKVLQDTAAYIHPYIHASKSSFYSPETRMRAELQGCCRQASHIMVLSDYKTVSSLTPISQNGLARPGSD